MKTLGNRLKEAREKKGVTLEMAADDTNISLRYLESIENNIYEGFHSEIYLVGFLKTYSEYLDFSSERAINLYRNYKIGEEDAPLEQLMTAHKEEVDVLKIVLFTLLGVSIIVAMVFLVLGISKAEKQKIANNENQNSASKIRGNKLFEMTNSSLDEILEVGDRVQANYGNKVYAFIFKEIKDGVCKFEQIDVIEQTTINSFDLMLFDERFFSLGASKDINFLINLVEIGVGSDSSVRVHFEYLNNSMINNNITLATPNEIQSSINVASPSNEPKILKLDSTLVLLTEKNPSNVDVQFIFKGDAYFKALINNQESIERYFEEGETVLRNMKSNVKVGVSNADRVRIKVGSIEVSMGKSGEVVMKNIHWLRNNKTGMWELLMQDAK